MLEFGSVSDVVLVRTDFLELIHSAYNIGILNNFAEGQHDI